MSIRQRIVSGLAANAFGQAVTIGSQLLLTPMFFLYWGAERYGEWLLLASIPAYFAMADLGIGSAAGNEMTMLAGQGQWARAQATFRSVGRIARLAGLVAVLLGLLLGLSIHQGWLFTPTTMTATQAFAVIGLLSSGIGLGFITGVYFAGFRCAGYNAAGITFGNLTRLTEALLLGALLWMQQSPVVMAGMMVSLKVLSIGIQHLVLRRLCPALHEPRVPADPALFQRLLVPSLGFLALPMAQAVVLQGPIQIIGLVLGPAAVAAFSAMRTLSRLPIQASGVLNHAIWPEFSRAWGQGDMPLVRAIHKRAWVLTVGFTAGCGIALLWSGEWLTHAWLRKDGIYQADIMAVLVLVGALHAVWNVSGIVLAAINGHTRMSLSYVLGGTAAVAAMYLIGTRGPTGALLWPLIVLELMMLATVLPQVMTATGDRISAFAAAVLKSPWKMSS